MSQIKLGKGAGAMLAVAFSSYLTAGTDDRGIKVRADRRRSSANTVMRGGIGYACRCRDGDQMHALAYEF